MRERHGALIVLGLSVVAGASPVCLAFIDRLPDWYVRLYQAIFNPVLMSLGLSFRATVVMSFIFAFLTGFVPVFIVGLLFLALTGGSGRESKS